MTMTEFWVGVIGYFTIAAICWLGVRVYEKVYIPNPGIDHDVNFQIPAFIGSILWPLTAPILLLVYLNRKTTVIVSEIATWIDDRERDDLED